MDYNGRSLKSTFWFLIGMLLPGILLLGATNLHAEDWNTLRQSMVRDQLEARDIRDPKVLEVMNTIPRHLFVPKNVQVYAYSDRPLPIAEGQTISQPYIVALMSQLLELKPGMKVLEIGTGSGYQAAVLDRMDVETYSIEIIPQLAKEARQRLSSLKYAVEVKNADGYFGWPEHAPFDRIIVTAAANHIPRPLLDQLKPGGHLILPLGRTLIFQTLTIATKQPDGKIDVAHHTDVRFVPMTGKMRE